MSGCAEEVPVLVERGQGHPCACHLVEEALVFASAPPSRAHSGWDRFSDLSEGADSVPE